MTETVAPRRLLVVRGGGRQCGKSLFTDQMIDLYREAGVEVSVVTPDEALNGARPVEALIDDPLARLKHLGEQAALARKVEAPEIPFSPSNRKARRAAAARSRRRK